jgi:hypothetical protein
MSGASDMLFRNTTILSRQRLMTMFLDAAKPFPTVGLSIAVRYSRGADFSGTCYYATDRLYVNLGRHLSYPYTMSTHVARTVSSNNSWWKPLYTIELTDAYQLVLFVLMHEYYHWLIKRAHRNTRQKESMCDRFAARTLVDQHGAIIRTPQGTLADRSHWDFQDLNGFVAAAASVRPSATASRLMK